MPKTSKDVVITSACRTGIGRYNGMWDKIQAYELGKLVIKNILEQSSINPDQIDEVIFGQVLTSNNGQNPVRQAAIAANIPNDKVSYIVNQVCGSGLRAIVSAYQSISLNNSLALKSCANCSHSTSTISSVTVSGASGVAGDSGVVSSDDACAASSGLDVSSLLIIFSFLFYNLLIMNLRCM